MNMYRRMFYWFGSGIIVVIVGVTCLNFLGSQSVVASGIDLIDPTLPENNAEVLTPTAYLPIVIKPQELIHITDDFSDPNSGWDVYDGVAGAEYINGEYRLVSTYQNGVAKGSAGHEVESFEVSTDCRLEDEAPFFNGSGYCVITFGNGGTGFHEFAIDSNKNWYLYHVPQLGYLTLYTDSNYTLLASGSSNSIQSALNGNRLKVIRENGNVSLNVNGVALYQGAIVYSGKAYISLKSQSLLQNSYGFDARFDNYELIEK
jgi:hypothetical protein